MVAYQQNLYIPLKTPTNNNFFNNAGHGISTDEEAKKRVMSPTGGVT